MLIRRVTSSGSSATVLTFSSTNQNVTCAGSFSSNSDRALKDGETPVTVAEAGTILDAIEAKNTLATIRGSAGTALSLKIWI